MSTLSRYASILSGNARSGSALEYGGAEKAMGDIATGMGVATTAMYPVVKNNTQYAQQYSGMANTAQSIGKGAQAYGNYKTALGLADANVGGGMLANMLSPGNIVGSGANLAMMSNPVTASLAGVNALTADEENPYGTIPGLKQANKFVSGVSDKLNQTPVAQGIRKGINTAYDQTLGRVLSTRPGQAFTSVASLPFAVAETGYNTVREGYQALDRNLFGGYLPFGAQEGKAETQRWDNPTEPLNNAVENVRNTLSNMLHREEAKPALPPVTDSSPNYDAMMGNQSQVDYQGQPYASSGGEQVGEAYSPLEQARSGNKVITHGGDKEGLNSLLDDLLVIGESKGIADKARDGTPTFSTDTYSGQYGGGGRPMIDTGDGPRPLISSPEFKTWIDEKAQELGPEGFMKYHQELTGGDPRLYTRKEIFQHFVGIDPHKPSNSINDQMVDQHKQFGAKFEAMAGDYTGQQSATSVNPTRTPGINPGNVGYKGISMNPVEGINRVKGEQGARLGGDTGIGSYRVFI